MSVLTSPTYKESKTLTRACSGAVEEHLWTVHQSEMSVWELDSAGCHFYNNHPPPLVLGTTRWLGGFHHNEECCSHCRPHIPNTPCCPVSLHPYSPVSSEIKSKIMRRKILFHDTEPQFSKSTNMSKFQAIQSLGRFLLKRHIKAWWLRGGSADFLQVFNSLSLSLCKRISLNWVSENNRDQLSVSCWGVSQLTTVLGN